ncbi:MAG: hypothetical protein LBH49_01070 [Puniceicoccales bacterium]|jgi:3-deoxy-D-manno-octulosonic-acid transferase|nr:hypothetical protein [Puniceicoccales bacterium]
MIWLYRLLFLPVALLMLPQYLLKIKRRGGYARDFIYRFGVFKKLPEKTKKRIWIQAVSVGEINSIDELVKLLVKKYEVVITTTTSTAYDLILKKYSNLAMFCGLFPLDFYPCSRKAWENIDPDAVLMVDGEAWPEHMQQAKIRNIPLFFINARISEKSLNRYRKFPKIARFIFSSPMHIIAVSDEYASIFSKFGAKNVVVSGNMKFDLSIQELSKDDKNGLLEDLGLAGGRQIILGSSTWPGEEEMLINSILGMKAQGDQVGLLLVPRHAERRREIIDMIEKSGLAWHQRSIGLAKNSVDVCLVDTTGELSTLTQLADVAFIGKSLGDNRGGQSPIDAAAFGLPMVYGDHMNNFSQLCSSLEEEQASIRVSNFDDASKEIINLIRNECKRKELSNRLKSWHRKNCGATMFTYLYIDGYIS